MKTMIETYGLEAATPPVDLSVLEDVFRRDELDLRGCGVHGWCVPSKLLPPRPGDEAHIVVDASAHPLLKRLIYAHEIGHAILGHEGTLMALSSPGAAFRALANEAEAWRVAAALLIPESARFGSLDETARLCRVPVWLAELAEGKRWPPEADAPVDSAEWWGW